MKSIQSKFVVLSIISILLCTLLVGGVGLWSMARAQEQSSDEILSLTCQQQSYKIDQELMDIEGSVNACADAIEANLPSPELLKDESFLGSYLSYTESLVSNIANNTSGIFTFYLRFDPDLSNDFAGFFYTREERYGMLSKHELTNIRAYDEDDMEHVGWYYLPREMGLPCWMEPYDNQNIGVRMVSYVVPMYVNEVFVGIVGMDIDFSLLTNAVRNIKPYQTGTAFLVSRQGKVFYHPTLESGEYICDHAPELNGVVKDTEHLGVGRLGGNATYMHNGKNKKLAYCVLNNNMVLMLSAETKEINGPVTALLYQVALGGLALAAVVACVVALISRRITNPLVQLADIASKIAEGNLDVEMPKAGNDEVGTLTRTLHTTVASLRSYIAGMSDKAYKDALTSVRNKAAYDEASHELGMAMASGDKEFALLMVDMNDLKIINDLYGHERGDEYLRAGCSLICRVFSHSPVFRVGGDEFVVILRDADYGRRDELVALLERLMEQSTSETDPWRRVSMAKGLGVCGPQDNAPEEVLHRADEAMYANKRKMKGERMR